MNAVRFQQEFLGRFDGGAVLRELFDLLPDVAFFMKDRQGRFVMQNRRSCEYCRVASELETVGKTDYDYFPKDRADAYVAGDRQVMESGEPILNAIAPAPEEEGSERLIIYSKIPVRDRHGKIIGVAGIHREIERLRASPKSYGRLSRAVQYAHARYAEPLTTRKLAAMVGISPAQFERRFRQLFGSSVRQYLLRLRVNAACRLLTQSEEPITNIALEVGFYDHSHFTRTFTRLMGVPPLKYRNRHRP